MLTKVFLIIEVLWNARGVISAIVEAVESLGDPVVKARIREHTEKAGVEKVFHKAVKDITAR